MEKYVYTLVCCAFFCAVIAMLSPGGENGGFSKLIAFAGAVVMGLAVLSPLGNSIDMFNDNWFLFEDEEHTVSSKKEGEYYAKSIGMAFCEIYKTDLSDIKAEVTADGEGKIVKVALLVRGGADVSFEEASETLSLIYGFDIVAKEG